MLETNVCVCYVVYVYQETKGETMGATAAYFFGIFLGCVFTLIGTALWRVACRHEAEKLQRQAAVRRYRLEQRMKQRDENR